MSQPCGIVIYFGFLHFGLLLFQLRNAGVLMSLRDCSDMFLRDTDLIRSFYVWDTTLLDIYKCTYKLFKEIILLLF